jgi:metal-responsive CopG/Arc/MetJ family transcriptional regulator
LKPSTENLLHAINMVYDAYCEKRSDLSNEIIREILKLRSKLQYFKEIDCE